jgi:hypothetical protein
MFEHTHTHIPAGNEALSFFLHSNTVLDISVQSGMLYTLYLSSSTRRQAVTDTTIFQRVPFRFFSQEPAHVPECIRVSQRL